MTLWTSDLTNAEGRHTGDGIWISEQYVQNHGGRNQKYLTVAGLSTDISARQHKRYELLKAPETYAGGASGKVSSDQGDAFRHGNQYDVYGRL